jgi:hypothetical protein
MSYEARPSNQLMVGAGTAKDLSATGVFAYTWNFFENARIWRLAVKTTTAQVSTGGIVVQFLLRPTYGSATNQVVLGTVTVPQTAATNLVYVNEITPTNIIAGSQVVANVSTAATTSGSGIAQLYWDFDPETILNEANFTKVTA